MLQYSQLQESKCPDFSTISKQAQYQLRHAVINRLNFKSPLPDIYIRGNFLVVYKNFLFSGKQKKVSQIKNVNRNKFSCTSITHVCLCCFYRVSFTYFWIYLLQMQRKFEIRRKFNSS